MDPTGVLSAFVFPWDDYACWHKGLV
jgi:hypothetical protein